MGTVVTEQLPAKLDQARIAGLPRQSSRCASANAFSSSLDASAPRTPNHISQSKPSLQDQISAAPRDGATCPSSAAPSLPTPPSKTPLFTPLLKEHGDSDTQPFDQAFADTLRPAPPPALPEVHSQINSAPFHSSVNAHSPIREAPHTTESFASLHHAQSFDSAPNALLHSASIADLRVASSGSSCAPSRSGASSPEPQPEASQPATGRSRRNSSSHRRRPACSSSAGASVRSTRSAHARRGSMMSIAGFTDLGSHEPHVAPPTISSAEAHHWRGASFSAERPRRPSNLMDAPLQTQFSLPAPLLPSLGTLQPSTDMVRIRSDPGYQVQLSFPPSEFSSLPPAKPSSPSGPLSSSGGGLSRTSTRTSATSAQIHRMSMSEQDMEEPDFNPLYLLLSTSADPELHAAWLKAGLVLVPPRHLCPAPVDMLARPDWVKSHAFEPDFSAAQTAGSASHWHSLGTTPIEIALDKGNVFVALALSVPSQVTQRSAPSSAAPRSPSLSHRTSRMSLKGAVPFPSLYREDEDDEDEILIPYRPPPRTIPIQTETTVYRRKPVHPDLSQSVQATSADSKASVHTAKPKPKFGGGKLKAPKWLQRASFSRSSISSAAELARHPSLPVNAASSSTDDLAHSPASKLEMLRVVALEAPLIPWDDTQEHEESTAQTPVASQRPETPDVVVDDQLAFGFPQDGKQVPASRNFFEDLRFFLDHEATLDGRASAVENILQEVMSWCAQFCTNYIYVNGWEPYTCRRIRIGVLETAWGDLVELFDAETKLFQMIENVVMGIMHEKIYVQSILRHYQSENIRLNAILDYYRETAALADLGAVNSNIDCGNAIDILGRLNHTATEAVMPPFLQQRLEEVCLPVLPDARFIRNLAKATPPFDIITCLRQVIDALMDSAQAAGCQRVGTDELLPLIAFTIVKSGLKNPKSLFLYAKKFTQSSLGPDSDWLLTTFEAASNYLLEDPLSPYHLVRPPSPVTSRRQSPVMQRRHTEDAFISPHAHQRGKIPPSRLSRCNSFTSQSDTHTTRHPLGYKQPSLSVPSLLDIAPSLPSAARSDSGMSASPVDMEAPSLPQRSSSSHSDCPSLQQEPHSAAHAPVHSFDIDDSQLAVAEDSQNFPQRFSSHKIKSVPGDRGAEEAQTERVSVSDLSASGSQTPLTTSAAIELRRSRADNSVKSSSDSWSTLFGFSPAAPDSLSSPAPTSPSNEDWYGWTRRRLSSVTSIGSLGSSLNKEPEPRSSLDLDRSTLDQVGENSTAVHHRSPPHWERANRPRPLSTVSLASVTSASSEDSCNGGGSVHQLSSSQSSVPRSTTSSMSKRMRRGSKLRRDLLVSSGQSALPPQVDFSTVQSLASPSSGFRHNLPHSPISPIREAFDPPFAPPASTTASVTAE